ncbi:MAG: peptidase M48 [Acidobacteria bacterium RIFCSPLOWO2_02_FULL_61_28]|nr:MAG: peptidase M48 [Acidobacteria bacterium RIFCSPLOWO2_02_FULL_61_28]
MNQGQRSGTWLLLLLFVSWNLTAVAGAAQDNQANPANPATQAKKNDSKKSKNDLEEIGNRNVGKGWNLFSLEREIALGKSLAQQVEQQSRLIQDPVVGEYVNRVGQNLVRNSDAQVPFTIKVIDSDDVNAFALPGGFFFVNAGLILATENEAELAGVMAHEIAHVAARHGTKQATKAELINWASIPLIFLGGPIGFGARSAAGLLIPLKFLQFSRGAEREADFLGLQYLYKTGYDPDSFISFFEKIQAREKSRPGTLAKAFSTHPLTPERITLAHSEIKTVLPARDEYVVSTSEYERVGERLRVLQNRGRVEDAKESKDRPTLRRTTRRAPTAEGTDPNEKPADQPEEKQDQDERPTLRRR